MSKNLLIFVIGFCMIIVLIIGVSKEIQWLKIAGVVGFLGCVLYNHARGLWSEYGRK